MLIIGGGDGGVLREVCKHECVEEVTLVEIDEVVPKVSKMYLPSLSVGFQNAKVNVVIADGIEYFKQTTTGKFDVIIIDSSDPLGPAEGLFRDSFYSLMGNHLNPSGVICTQGFSVYLKLGECVFSDLDLIQTLYKSCLKIFPRVEYANISCPTYTNGCIGFFLLSNDANLELSKPRRSFGPIYERKNLRYYNEKVHESSCCLPQFVLNALMDEE